MPREIISLIIWTLIFGFIVVKSDKYSGKIEGKIYKIHVFLAWLLLIQHFTAFRMLGWAVGHPNEIMKYFHIQIGPLPNWFNLSTWAGNLIFSIIATYISFSLAKRKEFARKWLLRILPLLYFFSVSETLKAIYGDAKNLSEPILFSVLFVSTLIAIPFLALYFFYRQDNVQETIFGAKKISP